MCRILISLAAVALTCCTPVAGSGVVVTSERPLARFSKVHVNDQLSVNIVRGDPRLTITADENLIDLFVADIDGEMLTLRMKGSRDMQPTYAHVELSSELLTGLQVEGASEVTAEATEAEEWRLVVSEGSTCAITNLTTGRLSLEVLGFSQVDLSGVASRLDLDVLGDSRVTSDEVSAIDAKVRASLRSTVTVRASRSIEAVSSGDSTVFVSGSPPVRDLGGKGDITFVDQ